MITEKLKKLGETFWNNLMCSEKTKDNSVSLKEQDFTYAIITLKSWY